MDKTKRRYSFLRVCLVVLLVMVCWVLLILAIIYNVKVPGQPSPLKNFKLGVYFESSVVSTVYTIFFFYISLNAFHRMAVEKAGFKRHLIFTILLFAGSGIYFSIHDYVLLRKNVDVTQLGITGLAISYFINFLLFTGIALVIVHINILRNDKKMREILEGQKRQLELEKIQANYHFLKAQVNPHFLHNTLNFLYARSLPFSNELSEGILTLSEIMRYSLDSKVDAEGKVPLAKEIEHVHNIIKIQQLRFDNSLQIHFDINGDINGMLILPFVLITIVENAFKHGELKSPEYPIRIELTADGNGALQFRCVNKKKNGPKELSTGIGLDNTRKRLELAYGENYSLYTREKADLYTVDLNLKL